MSRSVAKEIWSLVENDRPRARLLLPLDPTYIDDEIRFQEAVERLCRVFDWDFHELVSQVVNARTDMPAACLPTIRQTPAAITASAPR
jgi:hypothetical protein